jgi:cache 3/cache 2 fusion protein
MHGHRRSSARVAKVVVILVLALVGAWMALSMAESAAAQGQSKLEATIFSYDGSDFVRTRTTMVTESGKPAVNTKLDHGSPAYKALIKKHGYVGDATVFGRKYDADYAPLIGEDGKLTGALFVGVAK